MKNNNQQKRLNLALSGLVVVSAFSQQANEKRTIKPNILFIAVDDLKPELGCYGNSKIKTPNIDRLASQGTVFLGNYCQQAISGATRSSIMTGLRPDETKVWDLVTKIRKVDPSVITMPQYFISQGYITSGIGKIYHPTNVINEDQLSWSIPYLSYQNYFAKEFGKPALGNYQLPKTKALIEKYLKEAAENKLNGTPENDCLKFDPRTNWTFEIPKGKESNAKDMPFIIPSVESADVPDNAYDDGAIALRAKKQIITLVANNQPFFMAVGFNKPHLPFVSPKKYWNLYKRDEMPIAEFQQHAKNSPDLAYHNSGELRHYTDIPPLCSFTDQNNNIGLAIEKQKELIHGYYAAVSYSDAQVGVLLNTLDSLGMLKNTIIVLWGDHGWHLGDHDLWCKHSNFENATHSPLIISAPGFESGKTNSITEFVDVFPTLCDLANIPIPKQLPGKSLVPVLKTKIAKVKEYAVSQYPRTLDAKTAKHKGYKSKEIMGYSIRTANFRYTIWMGDDFRTYKPFNEKKVYADELYDYENDPLETINVVSEKKYTSVAREMKSQMLDFFKSQQKVLTK